MRYLGAFVVVAALSSVAAVQGQTVRSHSSLRIPTPALDEADDSAAIPRSSRDSYRGESGGRSVVIQPASSNGSVVPSREASLLREIDPVERSAPAPNEGRPALAPLDSRTENSGANSVLRSVSATSTVVPMTSTPVGTGVQYYGPSVGSAPTPNGTVSPAGFATQANYGAAISSPTSISPPTVVQTSFSAPATGACCSPAGVGPVVTNMQPTFAAPTFPSTAYPSTTVLAPPMTDAASFPPSLAGSTIPGAGTSGQMVPYLVNPVAVNIPAVPVDESRLQPVLALRPGVPEESYAGRGILGQPELYVRGQHVRNVLRYITLW